MCRSPVAALVVMPEAAVRGGDMFLFFLFEAFCRLDGLAGLGGLGMGWGVRAGFWAGGSER